METVDQIVIAILIAHQRKNSLACFCGYAKLGASHPGHVVEMLRNAGVLLPADAEVTALAP